MLFVRRKRRHHCFRCSLHFSSSDALALHLKSHGPIRRSCTLYKKNDCDSSIDASKTQTGIKETSALMLRDSSISMAHQERRSKEMDPPYSGGSQFPCNVCGRIFKQSNHLKLHERCHSQQKIVEEQSADSETENEQLYDNEDISEFVQQVVHQVAEECFADANKNEDWPSSTDGILQLVKTHARQALKEYCRNMEGEIRQLIPIELDKVLQFASIDLPNMNQNVDVGHVNSEKDDSERVILDPPPHNQSSVKSCSESKESAGSEKSAGNFQGEKSTINVNNCPTSKTSLDMRSPVVLVTESVAENVASGHMNSTADTPPKHIHIDRSYQNYRNTCRYSCRICHMPFSLISRLKTHMADVHSTKRSRKTIIVTKESPSVGSTEHTSNTEKTVFKIGQSCNTKRSKQTVVARKESSSLNLAKSTTNVRSEILGINRLDQCNTGNSREAFRDERNYKLHLKEHNRSKLYSCPVCGKVFSEENDLIVHQKKHVEKPYKCGECGRAYELNEDLMFHLSLVHPNCKDTVVTQIEIPNQEDFERVHCHLLFPDNDALGHHYKTSHSPVVDKEALNCSDCNKMFSNDALLKCHIKVNHSEVVAKWSYCKLNFPSTDALQSHMELQHTSPNKTEMKLNHDSRSIDLHLNSPVMASTLVPENSNPISVLQKPNSLQVTQIDHECSSYDILLSANNGLHSHLRSCHTPPVQIEQNESSCKPASRNNSKPLTRPLEEIIFGCSECTQVFRNEGHLHTHIAMQHTPVSDSISTLKCSRCDILFSDCNSLQSHIKSCRSTPILTQQNMPSSRPTRSKSQSKRLSDRLEKRAFNCSNCYMVFDCEDRLQNHIAIHHKSVSGSSITLKCLRCKQQFLEVSQFRSHMRFHKARVCLRCGQFFVSRIDLARHMNSKHSALKAHKCKRCSAQFSSIISYREHFKWHQDEEQRAMEQRNSILKYIETLNNGVPQVIGDTYDAALPAQVGVRLQDGSLHQESKINLIGQMTIGDEFNNCKSAIHQNEISVANDDGDVILTDDDDGDQNKENTTTGEEIVNSNDNENMSTDDKDDGENDPQNKNFVSTDDHQDIANSDDEIMMIREYVNRSPSPVETLPEQQTSNKSTYSNKVPSLSVSGGLSSNISDVVQHLIESLSDPQDSTQQTLPNNEVIANKLPQASQANHEPPVISVPLKNILKNTKQSGVSLHKSRTMLRVSFADDLNISHPRNLERSVNAEERDMPNLFPEEIVGGDLISSSENAWTNDISSHSPLLKSCYVPLTNLDSGDNPSNKADEVVNSFAEKTGHKNHNGKSKRNIISGEKRAKQQKHEDRSWQFERRDNKDPKVNERSKQTELYNSKSSVTPIETKSDNKTKKISVPTRLHKSNSESVINDNHKGENLTPNFNNQIDKITPIATSTPHNQSDKGDLRSSVPSIEYSRSIEVIISSNEKNGVDKNCKRLKKPSVQHLKNATHIRDKQGLQSNVGIFKCQVCGECFQSLPQFRTHKRTHVGRLTHKCTFCNASFPVKFLLGLHIADHFQNGIPQMLSGATSTSNSSNHKESNFSPAKNSVPKFHIPKKSVCNNTDVSKEASGAVSEVPVSTAEHLESQIDSVQNEMASYDHIDDADASGIYGFEDPPLRQKDSSSFSDTHFEHLNNAVDAPSIIDNNQDIEFTCKECDKCFSQLLKLKLHQSVHTGVGLYRCSSCDLMFHYRTSRDDHLRSHTDEKKYTCQYCEKQFDDRSDMVRHRTSHEYQNRYLKCKLCSKSFALQSTLELHMQLHSRELQYKCPHCEVWFMEKRNFEIHAMIHTGKKPYICKVCKCAFSRGNSCKSHIMRMHVGKQQIQLKSGQSVMNLIEVDDKIYSEMQASIHDIITKGLWNGKSNEGSTAASENVCATSEKYIETCPTEDNELPEPLRLPDSFVTDTRKSNSDTISADKIRKERNEKLCYEVKGVLSKMKRYSQIPIASSSRVRSDLQKTLMNESVIHRQGKSELIRKPLDASKNYSPTKNEKKTRFIVESSVKRSTDAVGESNVCKDIIARCKARPCEHCGKMFSEQYMKVHLRTHIAEKGLPKCKHCNRTFTSTIGLQYHQATHTDVRPFPCTVCDKTFKLKHQRNQHVRRHSAGRRYKCKICSKGFFSKGNLTTHILTHVDEKDKPFKCNICDRSFVQKTSHAKHVETHTGPRLSQCEVCSKVVVECSMKRHMKRHEP